MGIAIERNEKKMEFGQSQCKEKNVPLKSKLIWKSQTESEWRDHWKESTMSQLKCCTLLVLVLWNSAWRGLFIIFYFVCISIRFWDTSKNCEDKTPKRKPNRERRSKEINKYDGKPLSLSFCDEYKNKWECQRYPSWKYEQTNELNLNRKTTRPKYCAQCSFHPFAKWIKKTDLVFRTFWSFFNVRQPNLLHLSLTVRWKYEWIVNEKSLFSTLLLLYGLNRAFGTHSDKICLRQHHFCGPQTREWFCIFPICKKCLRF